MLTLTVILSLVLVFKAVYKKPNELLIFTLIVIMFDLGLIGVAISYALAYLIFLLHMVINMNKSFGIPKFEFDFKFWKDIAIKSIPFGLSIFFYIKAQGIIGAAKTSAYYAVAPFIGTLLSFIIFKEKPTWAYFLGLAIMILGTIIVVVDTLAKKHTHTHKHLITHTHDGSTHSHTIEHEHEHSHYVTTNKHIHNHKDLDLNNI